VCVCVFAPRDPDTTGGGGACDNDGAQLA